MCGSLAHGTVLYSTRKAIVLYRSLIS